MRCQTLIKAGDLMRAGVAPDLVIIDCRFDLADKVWGESNYRASHIPGALNRPFTENLRKDGTFLAKELLKKTVA